MTPERSIYRSEQAGSNGFSRRPGFRPFDPADAESTLAARFREVAARRGPATAVVDGENRVSYSELLQRAEIAAAGLRLRCGDAGGVVAICLPSGLPTVQAMLAALLGDFAYFCIDPSLPEFQIAELLRAADPVCLVREENAGVEYRGRGRPVEARGPAEIAALYATSGSTGEPKMVALSHRAILFDIGRQTNDLYLGPDDRFDSLFSFAFSAALATTFGPLLNGAELHCYNAPRSLTLLPDWLCECRITISTMTVSMLRHICLDHRPPRAFAAMRLLSVGGEALHAADVEAFRAAFPATCVLQNAMASTETRTYAQYFVPHSVELASPVPIGWPVAGKNVTLLDENGAAVPPGADGEIAVTSHYLADGYSNDPQRTATQFCRQPDGAVLYKTGDRGRFRPDGALVFLGRTDSQVKIRGHRVELDAVAGAIELHPQVRTAVVVTRQDPAGNDLLVAYVVARAAGTVSEIELREFLRRRLAVYAIPSVIVFLPELPLNANFKVDRRRLPEPVTAAAGSRAAGETLDVLRDLWKTTLQRADVPDDARFQDLGGDSLSAVRILVAVNRHFGCDLSPDTLHRFPTVKLLASCVEAAVRGESKPDPVSQFRPAGSGCPFFFVAGLGGSSAGYEHLAQRLAPHPAYGLNTSPGLSAAEGTSVESIAAEQVVQIRKLVAPGNKLAVVGYSLGGTIAFEIARQLRECGLDPLPVIVDMPAVNAPGASRGPARQALDILRNLPAWTAHEATHFRPAAFATRAYGNLRKMARSILAAPATKELDPMIYFGKASLPADYQAFLTGMYRAMQAYTPRPYPGRMVLLRAKTPTLFRSTDTGMGWQSVAVGGVEVHIVPGSHDNCISENHGAALAAVLSQCVSGFDSRDSAAPMTAESVLPA